MAESELPETAYRGLRRVGELSDDEWTNLKQLLADVEGASSDDVSRRTVLKTVAALGVGTVAGGMSAQQLVDRVEAAASTTDDDGNVGTPSNRVDVFADGMDASSVNTNEINTVRVASPGDIQAKLDDLQSQAKGRVVLEPAETYDPNSTIQIWDNLTLDFNGATIDLSSDIDLLQPYSGSRVYEPRVSLPSGYTSAVVAIDATADNYGTKKLRVKNGRFSGDTGDGTAIYIESGTAGFTGHLIDVDARGFSKILDLNANDAAGFINGNEFRGNWAKAEEEIVTRGTGDLVGNHMMINVQTGSTNAVEQKRMWRLENGRNNQVIGNIWDTDSNTQETWLIESTAAGGNKIHSYNHSQIAPTDVTDNLEAVTNEVVESDEITVDSHNSNIKIGGGNTYNGESGGVSVGHFADHIGQSVFVGEGAGANDQSYDQSVAIGQDATIDGEGGVVAGWDATAGGNAIALGYRTSASNIRSVAIGFDTSAPGYADGRIGVESLAYGANDDISGQLNNGEMTVYADEANSQFKFYYRDTNGTLRTATLAW